jgi:hypothetical protein
MVRFQLLQVGSGNNLTLLLSNRRFVVIVVLFRVFFLVCFNVLLLEGAEIAFPLILGTSWVGRVINPERN